MIKYLKKVFKWNKYEVVKAISGVFLFCLALNLFIVPNNLYNGGVLGLSQLIRTLIIKVFHVNPPFDISGIINFILNIPLFILAFKHVSKGFLARSLLIIMLQTLFLSVIPIPDKPLVDNELATILIGAIISGYGVGLHLSAGASGGGTEIIGTLVTAKNRNLSIGKIGIIFNVFVYGVCGLLNGLSIMIYSIIYSVIANITIDHTHEQNVCSEAFIFTKDKPTKIIDFIKNKLNRDVTYWEAKGGYDDSTTFITMTILSKYEQLRLERNLPFLDTKAFIAKTNNIGVHGEFQKDYNPFDK